MKKRLLLLTLLLVLVLTAVGCSSNETAEDALLKAQENAQNVKNMSVKATMNMKMSSNDQTMDVNYVMDMAIFNNPYKAKIDMNIDMGETGNQNTSFYLIPDGDKFYTYTQLAGDWFKTSIDKEAYEQSINGYDSTAYMEALLECKDSLKISEADEGDKKCYKLEGTLTGDAMKKMIEATNMKDQLASSGVDMSAYYDNLGDLKIIAYVEKDSYKFYKISIDMKDMMAKAVESASKAAGSNTEKISIDACTMDAEYTYDNAEDFELPAEAKDAQELQQ